MVYPPITQEDFGTRMTYLSGHIGHAIEEAESALRKENFGAETRIKTEIQGYIDARITTSEERIEARIDVKLEATKAALLQQIDAVLQKQESQQDQIDDLTQEQHTLREQLDTVICEQQLQREQLDSLMREQQAQRRQLTQMQMMLAALSRHLHLDVPDMPSERNE